MKKIMVFFISFIFVLSMSTLSQAADLPKPVHKLAHGAVDIATSPVEMFDHVKSSIDNSKCKVLGLLKGAVESPFYMLKKAGHGLVDVITFPIE